MTGTAFEVAAPVTRELTDGHPSAPTWTRLHHAEDNGKRGNDEVSPAIPCRYFGFPWKYSQMPAMIGSHRRMLCCHQPRGGTGFDFGFRLDCGVPFNTIFAVGLRFARGRGFAPAFFCFALGFIV